MTARHLRLVPAGPANADPVLANPALAESEDAESTPADRIRMAARRLGMIGWEMASHAEELRALTASYHRVARPAVEPVQRGGGATLRRGDDRPALRASG